MPPTPDEKQRRKDALKKLNEEIARLKEAAREKNEAKVKKSLEKIERLKRDFIELLPDVLGKSFGAWYFRLEYIDKQILRIGDDVERKTDVDEGKMAPPWKAIKGMIESMESVKKQMEKEL